MSRRSVKHSRWVANGSAAAFKQHRANELLQAAVSKHRAGNFTAAEQCYRKVLDYDPGNTSALNYYGLLAQESGRPDLAIELLTRALASDSSDSVCHNNLGNMLKERGRLEEAISAYQDAVHHDPDYINAHYNLGAALQDNGDMKAATECYRHVVRIAPGDAEAWNELGVTLMAQARAAEAIECFQRSVALRPDEAKGYNNLGSALSRENRLTEAISNYRKAAELKPDADTYNLLGVTLKMEDRVEEAIAAYREALRVQPRHVPSHVNLAGTLFELDHLSEAERICTRALELEPENAEIHSKLGMVRAKRGLTEAAVESFLEAIRLQPENAAMHCNLGNAFKLQDRAEAAIGAYKEALRLIPNYAAAYSNMGLVYMDEGDVREAERCYSKALELDPTLTEAYLHLARCRRFSLEDRAMIRRIEALLEHDGIVGGEVVNVHFALGKIYDDCELFDKAFEHYEAANRVKRKRRKFGRAGYDEGISTIISTFSRDYFERHKDCGDASERPIFIVGMARSGTTLTEQIISSHPQVHGAGELTNIHDIAHALHERVSSSMPFPACAELIDRVSAHALAQEYLEHLRGLSGEALRVTDKLPSNFLYLALIAVMLPRARIVHCRRDAMDVCFSNFIQLFENEHYYSYDLGDVAAYYRGYERLMSHWREVLPLRMHEVRYEQLVADQEGESRKLIDFCGLPWDERCLLYYKSRRTVRTASHWQVRQPIYQHSAQRWKRYEKYLGQLKSDLGYEG